MARRRRPRPDDRRPQVAVEVLLDGGDDGAEPVGQGARARQGDGAGDRTGAGLRVRRPHRVATLVLVVVLLVVVAANVAERRRAAERAALLVGLPGVVADLSAPLEVAWRLDGPVGGAVVGHLVLLQQPFRTDTALRAVDLRTGEVRWTLPRSGGAGVRSCTGERGTAAPEVVVCWTLGGPGLLVVDAADGGVRARHAIDPPALGSAVVGRDLVLVDRAGTTAVARRVSLDTGRERWRTSLELESRLRGRAPRGQVTVRHGLLVVEDATTVVLDVADGEVLGRWASPDAAVAGLPGADVVPLPGGSFAVWAQARGATRATRSAAGVVHHRDDGRVAIDGFVVEPEVTDGSAGHVLLLDGGGDGADGAGLVGVDVRDGRELWRRPFAGTVLLRVTGTVVTGDGAAVVGLDATTGTELWRTPVPGLRADAGWLTDGRRVLVASLEERAWELVAVRLDGDGVAWRMHTPGPLGTGADRLGGSGGLQAPAGVPVLVSPGSLTGLTG